MMTRRRSYRAGAVLCAGLSKNGPIMVSIITITTVSSLRHGRIQASKARERGC